MRLGGDRVARRTSNCWAATRPDAQPWPTGPHDGYFWEHFPFHLNKPGRTGELRGLLTSLDWIQVKLAATGMPGLLVDYTYDPDAIVTQAVRAALLRASGSFAANPGELPGQLVLVGRLMSHPDPAARAVAAKVSGWQGAPWLYP